MTIVAKSVKGQEFFYNAKSAHKVSKASAKEICKALNDYKYELYDDNEVWFVHEVDKYDNAFGYAEYQAFTRRNGAIRRVTQYGGWM